MRTTGTGRYDTWQAGAIIGAGQCATNISNCSTTIKDFWIEYGTKMVETLVKLPPQHGGFLSNCQAHCQTVGLPPTPRARGRGGGVQITRTQRFWSSICTCALETCRDLILPAISRSA